jgi:predicted enzyme related to lactoylglutathione lyase
MLKKQQFNIYLSPELIRLVKHKAIDTGQSLSLFVQEALIAYIRSTESDSVRQKVQEQPGSAAEPTCDMQLMSIIYASNMGDALRFYHGIGLRPTKQGNLWSELELGDAHLGIQAGDPFVRGEKIQLVLISRKPLEEVIKQLSANGNIVQSKITDEAYGRSLLLHDPDGNPIMINEYDPELYP